MFYAVTHKPSILGAAFLYLKLALSLGIKSKDKFCSDVRTAPDADISTMKHYNLFYNSNPDTDVPC